MIAPSERAPPDPAASALMEAARRAGRGGTPRNVLVLHLSAITAPRAHHARVARVIMTDVAQNLEGEVFQLRNGDLALLCFQDKRAAERLCTGTVGREGLQTLLQRLFADSLPVRRPLHTLWYLPQQDTAFQSCLATPPAIASVQPVFDQSPSTPAPWGDGLMHRRQAAKIVGGGIILQLEPCFEEIAVGGKTPVSDDASTDPLVVRHLAARVDGRTLDSLARQIAAKVSKALLASQGMPPLHVELALATCTTGACSTLARACQASGRGFGVGLSYAEACGAPERFAEVRHCLQALNATMILTGISPAALRMTRPDKLGAAMVKLHWTSMPPQARDTALAEGLQAIGSHRVVLQGAHDRTAVAWGLTQGITMFQGRLIDQCLDEGHGAMSLS